jgi:hypothetical protein
MAESSPLRRLSYAMRPEPMAGGVVTAAEAGGGRAPSVAVPPGLAPSSRTSLAQNAASASGGAVLTSLFVTPLEVLKVRACRARSGRAGSSTAAGPS